MYKDVLKSRRMKVIAVIGLLLLALGVAGFFSNPVLGYFRVDRNYNIFHIVTGLILLLYGLQNYERSKRTAVTLALVYGLLAIIGFMTLRDMGRLLGIFDSSFEDNFLNLFIMVLLFGAGLS